MLKNFLGMKLALFLFVILLGFVIVVKPYNNSPSIRSDGTGYHIWVHAIKERTLNFCSHREILKPVSALSMENTESNTCGVKYPPGVGIVQVPFTILFAEKDTSKGFTNEEHFMILLIGVKNQSSRYRKYIEQEQNNYSPHTTM